MIVQTMRPLDDPMPHPEEQPNESREHQGQSGDLQLLVHSVKDYAFLTFDLENRITGWSPGASRLFGWAEAEIIGQPGAVIFTPEDRDRGGVEEELGTARRTGRAEDERWHVKKPPRKPLKLPLSRRKRPLKVPAPKAAPDTVSLAWRVRRAFASA